MNTTKTYTCPATDGRYDREEYQKTFTGWMDGDIEGYNCAQSDPETAPMAFTEQKLDKDSTFIQMFGTCTVFWTKAQIRALVESSPELFNQEGYGNFFPYQNSKGERFVFRVDRRGGRWSLDVFKLESDDVWDAKYGSVLFVLNQEKASEQIICPHDHIESNMVPTTCKDCGVIIGIDIALCKHGNEGNCLSCYNEAIAADWAKEFDKRFKEWILKDDQEFHRSFEPIKYFISQTIETARREEREKFKKLITKEIATAHTEGDKTSRLTSLYMSLPQGEELGE